MSTEVASIADRSSQIADGLILGIETSCDETSVALLDAAGGIRANVVASQMRTHAAFGGVVPELAARQHLENLPAVLDEALARGRATLADVGLVAATAGPGLIGPLLVGLSAAKAIAFARDVPLVPVNHLEGHLYSAFLTASGEPARPIAFPLHGLVVTGGHAELVRVEPDRVLPIARTRDDAPGEAFDKIARRAGLPYPGGPPIDRIAARGDGSKLRLPVGRVGGGSLDFSFSGVKTAMLRELERRSIGGGPLEPDGVTGELADLFAAFQRAIVTALVERLDAVYERDGIDRLAVSGGVAANTELRRTLAAWGEQRCVPVFLPDRALTTDNAAMIAWAGWLRYRREGAPDPEAAQARSRWPLGEPRRPAT